MNETLPMRIGFVVAMIPLTLLLVAGASFMLGNGDWENTFEHWLWRIAFLTAPASGVIGLWRCATQPRTGMALVLLGAGSSAFLMPWMAPATVPVALAIIAFAAVRAGFIRLPTSHPRTT